ncbi:CorA family divalent cation transporter [Paenibacillus yanchengensis]|uniref:CorA family divalent cation transporter n=1 Tax=Paenibacillus yanchengensis TaxID=2035833 RepID=A0ABW4YGP5_9BACL
MIHRMFQYPADWTWQLLQQPQSSETADAPTFDIRQQLPECMDWLKQSQTSKFSYFRTQEQHRRQLDTISGSLFVLLSEDPTDCSPFHYYLSEQELITYHEELRLPIKLQSWTMTEQYKQCSSAAEAFIYMLSTLSEPIQQGLEQFAKQLAELELAIHARRSTFYVDQIMAYRSKLVQWEQIFLPAQQLLLTVHQLFEKQLQTSKIIDHTLQKWKRLDEVLQRYKLTIDSLIAVGESLVKRQRPLPWQPLQHVLILLLPAATAAVVSLFLINYFEPNEKQLIGLVVLMSVIVILVTTLLYKRLQRQRTDIIRKRSRKPVTTRAKKAQVSTSDTKPSDTPLRRSQRK